MVSSQDIAILFFSWRATTDEICSLPLRESPSRALCFFSGQDVTSFANTLLKGKALQKCSNLLWHFEKSLHFLLSLAPYSDRLREDLD